MKVAIATTGRFHVLDLARELNTAGHDVQFYSWIPSQWASAYGLPRECHTSFLPILFPLVIWERKLPKLGRGLREWLTYTAMNRAVILRMRRCDVFIFMSGIYLEAASTAKRRFGARLWLERGSQHILAQDEILAAAKGERPTPLTVRRELAGYGVADRIVIPSLSAEESFRRQAVSQRKLFRNAYGVDTRMFAQRERKSAGVPLALLYVGTWSVQKGCDVLMEAIGALEDVRLVHVGAIGDLPFPRGDRRFAHSDPVPQSKLPDFYAAADAFVLASRQDGFGMVLCQALASGLPVIATDRTGAPDLAGIRSLAGRISIVRSGDCGALAGAVSELRSRLISGGAFPRLTQEELDQLSWTAYGRRYSMALLRDVEQSVA